MVGTGLSCPALHSEHLPVFPAPCLSFPSPDWDFSNYRHSRQAWRGDQVTSPPPQPWSLEGTLLAAAPPGETIKRQKGRASIPEKNGAGGMRHVGRRPPLPAPRGVLASTGATGRWHVPIWNGHRHWHPAVTPALRASPRQVSQPGAGGLAPRQCGGVTADGTSRCWSFRSLIPSLPLADPHPGIAASAKSLPAVPAPASICSSAGSAQAPSGVSGRKQFLSTSAGLRGRHGRETANAPASPVRGEPTRHHGMDPCHRMGDRDHWLQDTLHVWRRAGTGIHEPSGCVQILHPKQERNLTRRTLVILGVTPPGVLQGGPPCSWGLQSSPLPGGAILAKDMENPRVKGHGLGTALCPSQEMGLCSRVVSASTASDAANLSAGRSVPSSSQPTPMT